MNIQYTIPGDLELSANKREQKEIKELLKNCPSEIAAESSFVCDYLPDFEVVDNGEVSVLTDGLIISDGKNLYWDSNYQIESFLTQLSTGGTITLKKV